MRFELLKHRKFARLTQQQIADKLGIKRDAYGRMETGKVNIPVDLALKIANFFGKKVEDIFLPDNEQNMLKKY